MLRKPGAEPSLRPEEQHENQARHDRRYGERQIDEGYEQTLARKIEFGDRPGCGKAKKHVERYADGRDQKGEPDGGQRIGLDDRGGVCLYVVDRKSTSLNPSHYCESRMTYYACKKTDAYDRHIHT